MTKDIQINLTLKDGDRLIIEFNDTQEKECTLLKSSVKDNSIWFGEGDRLMHLSQNMVKILLPHLQKFADTGDLF